MRRAPGGLVLIFVALWSGSAWTQEPEAQDRLVQLNKSALADADNLEWDRAKKTLLDALIVAKKAGLDNHPLMARTYVHLGVIYINGFKNREKAIQSFSRALEIQPDIRMWVGQRTVELDDVFAEAGAQPEPAHVRALDCYFNEVTRVDEAVPVRCAVASGLPVARVFLLYREPATGRFSEVEMKRDVKGWFQGRIPERVIYGQSVQVYFEGRNTAGKPIVQNGNAHRTNTVLVVAR